MIKVERDQEGEKEKKSGYWHLREETGGSN